jgi:hypothetical protein
MIEQRLEIPLAGAGAEALFFTPDISANFPARCFWSNVSVPIEGRCAS